MAPDSLWLDLQAIRSKKPIIHNLTNDVAMNMTANALLAIGASPLMSQAEEEFDDLAKLSDALVVNMGTLTSAWIRSATLAIAHAHRAGIPVVFDPVGAGATRFRTETAKHFLRLEKVTCLRGNASEILALHDAGATSLGVDSQHSSDAALSAAHAISDKYGCTVVISGAVDYIVSDSAIAAQNGHVLMTSVTAMGCTATALVAAFLAVNSNAQIAAAHAMSTTGIAGEIAAKKSNGPGGFVPAYLDALYHLSFEDVKYHFKSAP